MVRAGDQRVDVCLHLTSRQILSSFAIHAFYSNTSFSSMEEDARSTPARRSSSRNKGTRCFIQLHVFNASGDHLACDRRCLNKAELNQSRKLHLLPCFRCLPGGCPALVLVLVPPDLCTACCSGAFRLNFHPGLAEKCWAALSTQGFRPPNGKLTALIRRALPVPADLTHTYIS